MKHICSIVLIVTALMLLCGVAYGGPSTMANPTFNTPTYNTSTTVLADKITAKDTVTAVGVYVWKASGSRGSTPIASTKGTWKNKSFDVSFKLSDYLSLAAGTKYKAQFYATCENGKTCEQVWGKEFSFTTAKATEKEPTWASASFDQNTKKVSSKVSFTSGKISEVGVYVWKASGSRGKTPTGKDDTSKITKSPIDVWYTLSLSANTKYKAQFYAIWNGKTIWSKELSFTTPKESTTTKKYAKPLASMKRTSYMYRNASYWDKATNQMISPRNSNGAGVKNVHNGVDFKAGLGTEVYAITSGEIIYVRACGSGTKYNVIILKGSDGYYYEYVHLQNTSLKNGSIVFDNSNKGTYNKNNGYVYEGKTVSAGDVIGKAGGTGGFAPHLHLAIMTPKEPSATSIYKQEKITIYCDECNKTHSTGTDKVWARCRYTTRGTGKCSNTGYTPSNSSLGKMWLLDAETFLKEHGVYNTTFVDEVKGK